jgi:ferritin-like metal-binding protein YciE
MAGYMAAIALAEQIGQTQVVKLLNESLKEEQAADAKVRSIAQTIGKSAPAEEAEEEKGGKAKRANA